MTDLRFFFLLISGFLSLSVIFFSLKLFNIQLLIYLEQRSILRQYISGASNFNLLFHMTNQLETVRSRMKLGMLFMLWVIYSLTIVLVQIASFSLCTGLLTYENVYWGSWWELHWMVTLIAGTVEVWLVSATSIPGQFHCWRRVVTAAWSCVTGCDKNRVY